MSASHQNLTRMVFLAMLPLLPPQGITTFGCLLEVMGR